MTKPNDYVDHMYYGLTKREYFACHAMAGFKDLSGMDKDAIARCSVSIADALIAELNKEKPSLV